MNDLNITGTVECLHNSYGASGSIKNNYRLKITSCTVTNKFNDLLKFSIRSIVNIIDEILIFDDSNEDDYKNTTIYDELLNYNNVRIVKNRELDKDLGKKNNI
jgi:hypothetical protein